MSVWDTYTDRISAYGPTKRDAVLKREVRTLGMKLPDSLSYHTVLVFDQDHGYNVDHEQGIQQNTAIINSDNLNEKYIYSLPGEDIAVGSLIYWMDYYWMVTERDANTTVYTRAKLLQCNYLLKWVSDDNTICEQWCYVEDGTKYLTGEMEDRHFVVTRGDTRLALTIARNPMTAKLGRTNRFLIDDPDSPVMLAYILSKPFKLFGTFNQEGVYKFVLQEVETTGDDNTELGIADYYKHFPKSNNNDDDDNQNTDAPDPGSGKKVWL